jgi:type IV pilus assembly protein PilC
MANESQTRRGGLVFHSIDETKKSNKPTVNADDKITKRGSIVKKELLPFTQKLEALIDAGVPIVQALDSLVEQIEHPGMQVLLSQIVEDINAGAEFSEALRKFPDIFDTLYVSTISAGELSGDLPGVLKRLSDYMEESAELRRKIKSAMMYPMVVIIAAFFITIGLIVFVVPTFVSMFSDFGAELPYPTQILMNISTFLRENWYVAIGTVGSVYGLWKLSLKNEAWSLKVSKSFLHMPQFGTVITMIVMARFARTMSSLISSGLPILKAIDIVGAASGNKFVSTKMHEIKDMVESGYPLGEAMERVEIFPKMMLQMVSTGEDTGRIDQMLEKVADYYEKEVKAILDGLSSIIEPVLMLIVGSIIGGIAFAMFMPIFSLGEAVMGK